MKWLFIFGRTPELSFHELRAVMNLPLERLAPNVARLEGSLAPGDAIRRLGGTVKICREAGKISSLRAESLLPFLPEGKRLTFGLSGYGDVPIDTALFRSVKEAVEASGVTARFVTPKEGKALTSVVVAKQHVCELVIIDTSHGFIVGETVAVQDFEEWNRRDYGRPHADPKAGMLPPKVARMAVNLAGHGTLLDPFCGMGTILAEALLTGWNVIGSDQSAEVVEKAKKNLEWLAHGDEWRLFVSDATHVSEHLPSASIDAVVTEPFMGSADVQGVNIPNVMKGLEKLYIGCLKDWYHLLKPKGKVIIALPEYAINGRLYFVKTVIDRCETLGYTVVLGPLLYSRPNAVVRRKLYVLQRRDSKQ